MGLRLKNQQKKTCSLAARDIWNRVAELLHKPVLSPLQIAEEVMEALDYREKGGYVQKKLLVHPLDATQPPVEALVYIGTSDNPNWAGPSVIEDIAKVIAHSVGPSGPNIDYLLNLAEAMRRIAPSHADPHLEQLKTAVLALLSQEQAAAVSRAAVAAVDLASLESAMHCKGDEATPAPAAQEIDLAALDEAKED